MLAINQLDMLLSTSRSKLAKVYPPLAVRVERLICFLAQEDLSFGVHMGLRAFEEQVALYAQGRETLDTVNFLRKIVAWGPISQLENKIVTKLKVGYHNFGLAVDLVEDGDPAKVGIQWSWANNAAYLKIGKYATLSGVSWGGVWKAFKDYPHVELTRGLSIPECVEIYKKGGLIGIYREMDGRV